MWVGVVRHFGQAGARASLPIWRVDPTLQSDLLNLNGLAHKVTLEAECFAADSDRSFDRLPLYDPVDDDSTEHFRRRFINSTFNVALPARFDERAYDDRTCIIVVNKRMVRWTSG